MGYMTVSEINVNEPKEAPERVPLSPSVVAEQMEARRETIEKQIQFETDKRKKANDRIRELRAELLIVEKLWRAAQPPKPRKAK